MRRIFCGVVFAAFASTMITASPAPSIDAAFERFWAARNTGDAKKAAEDVVRSGVTFDDALARLKRGRQYDRPASHDVVHEMRRAAAGDFTYDVFLPEGYDPQHRYQVRFQLHGGVMMREQNEEPGRGRGGPRSPLRGAEQIYVMPAAWREAPWWSAIQLDNLDTILDRLKRTYNVDENRIVVSGVSDGATGTFYVAMRDTTPYASFASLNGSIMVLANDRLDVGGELFPTNLLNKPFFIVNGGRDPLYPTRAVEPYVEHLRRSGVTVDYKPQPDGVHNTAWWPEVKD
jgi:predicted esterase